MHAISCCLVNRRIIQREQYNLQRSWIMAKGLHSAELCQGLARNWHRRVWHFLQEFIHHIRVMRNCKCHILFPHCLCLCAAEICRKKFLVCRDDGYHDVANACDYNPTIYHVSKIWMDRYFPATRYSQILCYRCIFHLSASAIHSKSSQRAR